MNALWEKNEIKSICETSCVCLKLASDRFAMSMLAELILLKSSVYI